MNFIRFFQGPDGENSSKRLAGLLVTIDILYIAFHACEHFIATAKDAELNNLIETLCFFAGGLLTVGLAEIFMKKKYNQVDKD